MVVGMLVIMGVFMIVRMFMAMRVFMIVRMFMAVGMFMIVGVFMAVGMFMIMGVFMAVFVLQFLKAVDAHPHMSTCDTAGGTPFRLHPHPGQAQAVHGVQKTLLVLQQFIQSGQEHVPRRAHMAFDVKCFHCNPSIWLIILAR